MSWPNPYLTRHIGQHAALAGRDGLDELRSLAAEYPELKDQLAESLDLAAHEYRLKGQLREAVTVGEEAAIMLRPMVTSNPAKGNLLRSALEGLAAAYTDIGELNAAEAVIDELDQLRAGLSARPADSLGHRYGWAIEAHEIAVTDSDSDLSDGDVRRARRSVRTYRRLAFESAQYRPELATALTQLARLPLGATSQKHAHTPTKPPSSPRFCSRPTSHWDTYSQTRCWSCRL